MCSLWAPERARSHRPLTLLLALPTGYSTLFSHSTARSVMAEPAPKPLHDTTGVLLIAVLINSILFGAVCVQVYEFFHRKRKDGRWLRRFVTLLCTLDTLQLATCYHAIYFWLVVHYGEPSYLLDLTWSTNLQIGLTVGTCFLVRCFYAYRLWRMSQRSKCATVPIIVFNLACLGLGLGLSAYTFVLRRFDQLHRYQVPTSMQLACAFAADAYITGAMSYHLQKGKSGIPRTNSLINKLILWTVSTGLITAIVELLALISWTTMHKTLVYAALEIVLGKLYTNAMLAMLNGRPLHPNIDDPSSGSSARPDVDTSPHLVFRPAFRSSRLSEDSFTRTTPTMPQPVAIEFTKLERDPDNPADIEQGEAPRVNDPALGAQKPWHPQSPV